MSDSISEPGQLYQSKHIARNSLYNILGQILPFLAALIAIPLLIQGIGKERFGILSIGWMLMGYFSLLDLGLARVMTKLIGEKLGHGKQDDIREIFWSGLLFLLLLGLCAGGLLALAAPAIVSRILNIPPALQQETRVSFLLLAAGVPLVTTTTGLRGTLEAFQKFGLVNIARSLSGILLFSTPLLLLHFTSALPWYILALLIVRLVVGLFYAAIISRSLPALRKMQTTFEFLKDMFRQGIWMSISNILGPVMVYFDRFFIGAWLSMAAVTFYVTPYEVVSKSLLITTALVRVLFPAFSTSYSVNLSHAGALYRQGLRALYTLMFPLAMLLIALAEPGLRLWLGSEFADKGTQVAQWLAIGCLVNSPAQIAFSLIQAAGRADFTAKLHIVEIPFYLLLLYVLVHRFGISGAALAWCLRALIDSIILVFFAHRLLKNPGWHKLYSLFLASTMAALLATALQGTVLITASLTIIVLFLIFNWHVSTPAEKNHIRHVLKITKRVGK
ncbi:MAG: flippase [candidate division KSB1 bacterium]|nr:flippase [candidate division KSB1 bacterium]